MVDRVSKAFEKLTPREREILRLIAAHLQSKEIARALGLSPKTVEMHVLSARRRLSGLSRRDAALAFVAWEGGDPGNDYRKRPGDLAELPDTPLSDRGIGSGDGRAKLDERGAQRASETGSLRGERGRAEEAGVGFAENAGPWRAAFQDLVSGHGDDAASHERPAARRDWRHEMSNLQWLGLVLGVTALTAFLLAVIAIGVHEFIMTVQRITHR